LCVIYYKYYLPKAYLFEGLNAKRFSPRGIQKVIKNAMEINNTEEILDIPFIKGYSTIPNAKFLDRFIKAMKPWPAAWTKVKINEKELRLKLIDAHLDFKTGYLVLDKVQLEGKGPVSWNQFKSAYQI